MTGNKLGYFLGQNVPLFPEILGRVTVGMIISEKLDKQLLLHASHRLPVYLVLLPRRLFVLLFFLYEIKI